MRRAVRVNATMDEELVRRLDAFAASRHEDRSTALRQLVDFAMRELQKGDALEAYRAGRVTLREFARTLGLDVWSAQDLLAAEGVPVAQGARDETQTALEAEVSAVVAELRGIFRDLAPGRNLVDELIAERREEARRKGPM